MSRDETLRRKMDARAQFFQRDDSNSEKSFDPKKRNEALKIKIQDAMMPHKIRVKSLNETQMILDQHNALQRLEILREQIFASQIENANYDLINEVETNRTRLENLIKKRQAEAKAKIANASEEEQYANLTEDDLAKIIRGILLKELKKPFKSVGEVFNRVIDLLPSPIFRALSLIAIFSAVLAACSTFSPNPEFPPPGGNSTLPSEVDPSLTGEADPSTEGAPSTEVIVTQEAGPSVDEQLRMKVVSQITVDSNYQSPYIKALEAGTNQEIPQACAEFALKLTKEGHIDPNFNVFGINSYGLCYAWNQEAQQLIVNQWDASGPLYITAAGGNVPGATLEYRNPSGGRFAELLVNGVPVRGVNGTIGQWEDIVDGELASQVGAPEPAPTSTAVNQTSGETRPAVMMPNEAAIDKLVADFLSGALSEVGSLSSEQRAAFSVSLAEKINEQAIELSFNGGEAYFDLQTLTMRVYGDGSTPEQRKYPTAIPVEVGSSGQVYALIDGVKHLIKGLNATGGNKVISDPYSTEINWPTTERFGGASGDLVMPQAYIDDTNEQYAPGAFATEMVFLRPILGKAYFDQGKQKPDMYEILEFAKPIYDSSGNLIMLQRCPTKLDRGVNVYAEGENWEKRMIGGLVESNGMDGFNALGEYQTVYMFVNGIPNPFLGQQNQEEWPGLHIHDQKVLDLLKNGQLVTGKVPLVEVSVIVIKR